LKVSRRLTRKENNASAIEAWEKSIKIQPSADAYTSKFLLSCFFASILAFFSFSCLPCSPAYAFAFIPHTSTNSSKVDELTIDMASAYVMGQPPNPALAIKHLT
jgi:hypothetical protein